MKKLALAIMAMSIIGCSNQQDTKPTVDVTKTGSLITSSFSVANAKANLVFAKDQYLKMINNVETGSHLHPADVCGNEGVVCFPRAEEDGKIHMERPLKWTNGFYQGVLWQLLANKDMIDGFSPEQEKMMYENASFYQDAIISEAKRGNTHDLGFLLYDSFGEALRYDGLTSQQKNIYNQALVTGRETLATRYDDEKELIKSWDWKPQFIHEYKKDGELKKDIFDLRDPWDFPVIVDNMMNLDFMLSSSNPRHHKIAYDHAYHTHKNHYFYADSDTQEQFPIAYHVFDYGENKPGNWQGIGNISAWARGQAWSLYGFATVAEAAQRDGTDLSNYIDFQKFTDSLFGSVKHLTKDDAIPDWDFFASRDDAYKIAENVSSDTAIYSNILNMCAKYIADDMLPYKGWRPIQYDAAILSDEAIAFLSKVDSINDEPMIQNGQLTPCGTDSYDLTDRVIPKDTSAAALYASAVYRLAQFTDNTEKKVEYIAFGDRIMSKLTEDYLTSKTQDASYKLGFVMEEATGNFPAKSEINVPIVYADFYFIEANVRRVQLENAL